eukprot:5702813-Lingulodinium_polyedra.AAC.1
MQEARIRDAERPAAEALARARGFDLRVGPATRDGALLAAAAKRGSAWMHQHPLPEGPLGA